MPLRISIAPVSDDAIETLLEHWARWCAAGQWRPSRCGSAEGRHLPVRVSDDDDRRPAPRPFGELELLACERAVSALPPAFASFVRAIWVRHSHPAKAARLAGLRPSTLAAWPAHRAACFQQLRQRLHG